MRRITRGIIKRSVSWLLLPILLLLCLLYGAAWFVGLGEKRIVGKLGDSVDALVKWNDGFLIESEVE